MLRILTYFLAALAVFAGPLRAAPSPSLPALAGWHVVQTAVNAGAVLSESEIGVMREFGLRAVERGDYRHGGEQIEVTGYWFSGAGGAFGAYSYLRSPADSAVKLRSSAGPAVASGGGVLFPRGRWLLQVKRSSSHIQPGAGAGTDAAVLRLANGLARKAAIGAAGKLPEVLFALPAANVVPGSAKFAQGPLAFAAAFPWVAARNAGFGLDAQAAVASYVVPGAGVVQLAILSYPTPQIADRFAQALRNSSGVAVQRRGLLVLLSHGSKAAAAAVLALIHSDEQVVMTPFVPVGLAGLPALILAVFLLCLFIMGAALVIGLLSGAVWVGVQRWLPERFQRLRPRPLTALGLGGSHDRGVAASSRK